MALRAIAVVGGAAGAVALALASFAPAAVKPRGDRSPGSLAGQLLVATPSMGDPRFSRTVIYMARHDANGALGLVLNRPYEEVPLALLLERLGLPSDGVSGSMRIHYGGPVEPGRVFVLHTDDWRGEGTEVLSPGIALTTHAGVLRAVGSGKGPRRALLFLSYSGWGPGQLERELRTGAWTSVPADLALAFDGDYATKWQRALGRRSLDL